ncbi:hypothetical protein MBLNU457_g0810t1 [Dothideomycetes sp. NU457]
MNQYDGQQGSSADTNGYTSNDSESRSPLSNLNFLRNMTTSEKKQTKDGQPQKRRGPKPDSKPALTRRQELNRQAQRTHRERKEQYIKALEHELLRVKDLYGASAREKDQAVAEVARLKDILARHGIHYESPASSYNASMPSYTGSTAGSVSGAYRQDSNTSAGMSPPPPMSSHMTTPPGLHGQPMQMSRGGIDYDQLGIDFVLECEKPCLSHKQYLVVRSHNPEGQPHHHPMERPDDMEYDHMSGHALMATCPPMSHIMDKPGEPYPHQMPDMSKSALMKLLESSAQLPGIEGGEVTPVRAWWMIIHDERVFGFNKRDFELLKLDLLAKVRCYGFGAVLEEFEVADAIANVVASKESVPAVAGVMHAQAIMA